MTIQIILLFLLLQALCKFGKDTLFPQVEGVIENYLPLLNVNYLQCDHNHEINMTQKLDMYTCICQLIIQILLETHSSYPMALDTDG